MSTEWDLFCVDCDVGMQGDGLSEWRSEEPILAIIDNRNALCALADLVAAADVELFVEYKKVDLHWLYKHVDHDLVAQSEYGDVRRPACPHGRYPNRCVDCGAEPLNATVNTEPGRTPPPVTIPENPHLRAFLDEPED